MLLVVCVSTGGKPFYLKLYHEEPPMKEDRRPQEICAIWIDHTNRIISFRKEDGFEPHAFLSPDEQMQYALEKCSNGYRVQ